MKVFKLRTRISSIVFLCLYALAVQAQEYTLTSPDQNLKIEIKVGDAVTWAVSYKGEALLLPSPLALELGNGTVLGANPKVAQAVPSSVNEMITAAVPVKNRQIPEVYQQLRLEFAGNYALDFRAYNDGVAYRFDTSLPQAEITIKNEKATFNFAGNFQAAWPLSSNWFNPGMMRNTAAREPGFGSKNPESGRRGFGFGPPPAAAQAGGPPAGMPPGAPGNRPGGGAPNGGPPRMPGSSPFNSAYEYSFSDSMIATVQGTAGLPIYLSSDKGTKMVLVESDLYDYPNLFVKGTAGKTLQAAFPRAILKEDLNSSPFSNQSVSADYLAKTKGTRTFPWRAMVVSPDDKGLLESDLVYKLSSPPVIITDWIKPGQVAWEWYNDTNIFGVDFESGINTPTYKYYIDFAADYGIEYLLIDAGWKDNADVDIPEVIAYGTEKGVDVLLWLAWTDLYQNTGATLDKLAGWGAKGIKVDYMNRADQQMVNFYERLAMETAERKMLLDFHGAYKPVGLNRKYPNVVNYEGVKGMEANKLGSEDITPSHDVTLVFTRMVAGPMDYTPGAVETVGYGNFRNSMSQPMSQGTRAHQAAMYVLFDAPIQMLADNATLYRREDEFTKFLTRIPTVWDKTIGLEGKIGQYAMVARKNGDNWYIGAMTDWSERSFEVALDFLGEGKYQMDIFADGVNANRRGVDYKLSSQEVSSKDKVAIAMKQGGGWVAILTPVNSANE